MRYTFFGDHEGAMFILPLLPDKTRVLRSVDHSPSNAQVYVPDRGWEHCSSLWRMSIYGDCGYRVLTEEELEDIVRKSQWDRERFYSFTSLDS